MWLYGYSKQTDFTLSMWQAILDFLGYEIYVSIFLLKYLGIDPYLSLFWIISSLAALFLIRNGPLKGHVSNFASWWITNSITYLLLRTNSTQLYFRCGGKNFLDIWKDLYWHCWPVGLWTRLLIMTTIGGRNRYVDVAK